MKRQAQMTRSESRLCNLYIESELSAFLKVTRATGYRHADERNSIMEAFILFAQGIQPNGHVSYSLLSVSCYFRDLVHSTVESLPDIEYRFT